MGTPKHATFTTKSLNSPLPSALQIRELIFGATARRIYSGDLKTEVTAIERLVVAYPVKAFLVLTDFILAVT